MATIMSSFNDDLFSANMSTASPFINLASLAQSHHHHHHHHRTQSPSSHSPSSLKDSDTIRSPSPIHFHLENVKVPIPPSLLDGTRRLSPQPSPTSPSSNSNRSRQQQRSSSPSSFRSSKSLSPILSPVREEDQFNFAPVPTLIRSNSIGSTETVSSTSTSSPSLHVLTPTTPEEDPLSPKFYQKYNRRGSSLSKQVWVPEVNVGDVVNEEMDEEEDDDGMNVIQVEGVTFLGASTPFSTSPTSFSTSPPPSSSKRPQLARNPTPVPPISSSSSSTSSNKSRPYPSRTFPPTHSHLPAIPSSPLTTPSEFLTKTTSVSVQGPSSKDFVFAVPQVPAGKGADQGSRRPTLKRKDTPRPNPVNV